MSTTVAGAKLAQRDLRGINVAGAEFSAAGALSIDAAQSYKYLGARGHSLVRVPLLWESIQPKLSAPLSRSAVDSLRVAVSRARSAGLSVVIDIHNYAKFNGVAYGAPGSFTQKDFVDLWRRISVEFKNEPAVVGYGLMNEPRDLPTVAGVSGNVRWQRAQQAALTAIRGNGDVTCVLVSGYNSASMGSWLNVSLGQPVPYIVDPANNFRWEAHHYWDATSTGKYTTTYGAAVAAGFGTSKGDGARTAAYFYLDQWLRWLKTNNQKGFIGEFGWPSAESGQYPGDADKWNSLAKLYLDRVAQENVGQVWTTAWATGDRWSDGYNLQYYASSGTTLAKPLSNAAVLESLSRRSSRLLP